MSSASLMLTDRGLALSEPVALGAGGSTKTLAALSLGGSLVFVSSAVVAVALLRHLVIDPFLVRCRLFAAVIISVMAEV